MKILINLDLLLISTSIDQVCVYTYPGCGLQYLFLTRYLCTVHYGQVAVDQYRVYS